MKAIGEEPARNSSVEITSTTEFFSDLFFTLTSLTKFALGGRQIMCSACLNSLGSGSTGKFILNIFAMLIASSSNKFPWQIPSMYSCANYSQNSDDNH